jgi:serine/threonine-protein kinase RsbW
MENNSDSCKDEIKLSLPFKSEYVSIARLAVSGIASRIGFDTETIEDIKVAVAEVCNRIISSGSKSAECFNIIFNIFSDKVKIIFECKDENLLYIFNETEDEIGISIIKALMDEIELTNKNEQLISMYKVLPN